MAKSIKSIKPTTLPSFGTRKTFRVTPKMWSHFYKEALKKRAWAKKLSREPGWEARVSGMTAESARKALRSTPEELAIEHIRYTEMRANLRSSSYGPDYPLDKPATDLWRKLGGSSVGFNLLDSSNRVVGRAKSKVAAHRATRKSKYIGTRVVTLNRAKHVFPPGARVLIDGRDEARVKQAFPEGSSSYLFPHYKLAVIGGDTNVAVHMSRVGVERRTLNRAEHDEELAEAEAQAEIERLAEAEAQAEIDELAQAPESWIDPEEPMTVYEPEVIEPVAAMTVYEPPESEVTYEEPRQTESFHVTVTRLS